MKIGITGGTGFVGQKFIEMFGSKYELIVATSKESTASYCQRAVYRTVNYTVEDFKKIFAGCNAVIHLGGKVMRGMDDSMNVSDYVNNLELCENVFRACKEMNIRNVVFTSSVAVYDQQNSNPVCEGDNCQPNSMYGVMKVAAEKIAEIYNRRYGMCIKILRVSQILGIHEKIDCTQFWDLLLINSYNNRAITIYGKGLTGRDVIYVKDVALALSKAVETPEAKGIYNIGIGSVCTNLEIAQIYREVFHCSKEIRLDFDKEESGIQTCLDCKKAEKDFNFKPHYNLQNMVIDMKEEFESLIDKRKLTI